MDTLSRLMVRAYCETNHEASVEELAALKQDLQYVSGLGPADRTALLEMANSNHVIMRALSILKNAAALFDDRQLEDWCEHSLTVERARIDHALKMLAAICGELEARGCKITVIKSLDHWPDLGSDLDLYTTADEHRVKQAMDEAFKASPVERSWGDR